MWSFEGLIVLSVIGVPSFLFWQWLYKKFISDKTKMLVAT
jgi:hypothetical protein